MVLNCESDKLRAQDRAASPSHYWTTTEAAQRAEDEPLTNYADALTEVEPSVEVLLRETCDIGGTTVTA